MPTQRLSMRRIKEVLRLKHFQGLPERAIARSVGVSNGVVHSYVACSGRSIAPLIPTVSGTRGSALPTRPKAAVSNPDRYDPSYAGNWVMTE
ncbi:hypothetical protein ACVIU7_007836 [Bradyrhizobium liaoningense]